MGAFHQIGILRRGKEGKIDYFLKSGEEEGRS